MSMEDTMAEMLIEIKKTNTIMVDMAKDIKDMKGFMHVLCNKLGGML